MIGLGLSGRYKVNHSEFTLQMLDCDRIENINPSYLCLMLMSHGSILVLQGCQPLKLLVDCPSTTILGWEGSSITSRIATSTVNKLSIFLMTSDDLASTKQATRMSFHHFYFMA